MLNNQKHYLDNIAEKLSWLAVHVKQENKSNLTDTTTMSEAFYREFISKLFNWSIINLNSINSNTKGADLICEKKKILFQVSSTGTRNKIQSSLHKVDSEQYHGYRFVFVLIGNKESSIKKDFDIPESIEFSYNDDLWDNSYFLRQCQNVSIDTLESLSNLLDKYFKTPQNDLFFDFKVDIEEKNLSTNFDAFSSKLLFEYSEDDPIKAHSYIIGAIADFIEIIKYFNLTSSVDNITWKLLKNSLFNATENIINNIELRFRSKTINWNIEDALNKAGKVAIDFNFLNKPSESQFSNFYCDRLCEWLSLYINDEEDIGKVKKLWPISFTNSIITEWRSDQNYNKLLQHLDNPFNEHLIFLNELNNYIENCLNFADINVFDEPIKLKQIYVDIFGAASHRQRNIHKIVNVQSELCKWANDAEKDMCIVSGDPGSGKSTVMKMLASALAEKGTRVVFIDLYKLNFSEKKPAIDVLEEYLAKISWLKKYDFEKGVPIVLILDGLDEIKVDVWKNAQELVGELHNSIYFEHHKVIISGRKKIVDYCSSKCEYSLKIEMLPLKLSPTETNELIYKQYSERQLLDNKLQEEYWNKLMHAFNERYPLENLVNRAHLSELCASPLMLFLLAWTIKYSDKSVDKIHHSVELYESILNCVYSRRYNRNEYDRIYQSYKEYKKILTITGLCAWHKNSKCIAISHIEEYCYKANLLVLFKQWIDYHQTNNPSKLLLLFFFREKLNTYSPQESEIEFIHKSFFEFLAAIAILDIIYMVQDKEDNDFYFEIFNVFSKSLIGVEIQEFIEGLLEFQDEYDLRKYAEALSNIMPRIYNANWPIALNKNEDSQKIEVPSYTQLMQSISNIEDNFIRLSDVLSRIRERNYISVDSDIMFHFEESNFNKVNWMWHNLSKSSFFKVEFNNSVLTEDFFCNCFFNNCSFSKTNLNSCDMSDSKFSDCDFTSAYMEASVLENSDLSSSNFDGVVLEGGYLGDAIFDHVKLIEVNLVAANLDNTTFTDCIFANVNFERAILYKTSFVNVEWTDCIMENAKLINVNMSDFDLQNDSIIEMLSEADLSEANWTDVDDDVKNNILDFNNSKDM